MGSGLKKSFAALLLAAGLLAGCGPTSADIEKMPSTMHVRHDALTEEITANMAAAQKKYDDKVVTVSGPVMLISKDLHEEYAYVVFLVRLPEAPSPYMDYTTAMNELNEQMRSSMVMGKCSFTKQHETALLRLQAGDSVRIKGKIKIKSPHEYDLTGCILQ